jgi:DNA polymerase I
MSEKTMFLIDGSALAYRSYFAFIRNPLINSKGENTSVCFGFINSLLSIINQHNPTHIAVVFDTKAPTHRHKLYKEYKSTRAKMPEDMADQLPRLHEVVEAMNIPIIEKDGVEADDVIATLAVMAAKESYDILIVTPDKDFNQLVNDKIKVYKPQKGGADLEIIDSDGVIEKMGVPPEKVIDLLGLMGDASDNVPGVPGVGPKTAVKLLNEFGSLQGVLDNAEKIAAKGVRTKVMENKEKALLSLELVTILTDVEVGIEPSGLMRQEFDSPRLKKLFTDMEFDRFMYALNDDVKEAMETDPVETPEVNYKTVTDIDEVKKIVDKIRERKALTIDTETTSINAIDSELVGISIALDEFIGWYLPVGHELPEPNLPIDKTLDLLKPLLEDNEIEKNGQNLKYDYQVFANYDIHLANIAFDTMIASYLINPSGRQHNLGRLAMEHLNYKMQPITDLIGTGKKQKSFATVPVDKATFYAVEDVDVALQVKNKIEPQIESANLQKLYHEIELPLVEVLAEIELAGVKIDSGFLSQISGEMQDKIVSMVQEIYNYAGEEFNINSTKQLQEVLFTKLGLKPGRKTTKKTGYSTNQQTLEELAKEHPLPKILLDYRQLTKLKNTYIDAIPALISPKTGRVHTSFNQTVAATGRLSSSDPNLQNIPIRTEEGARIRKAFVPRDNNYVLLGADYSQVELRIMAHISRDEKMIEAFQNDQDIHSRTASEVYGVPLDDVTSDMRRMAKTANFAVIYGVTAYGLSMQSDMNMAESKQFIDTYFARYPGIKKFMEDIVETTQKNGYVTTLFNRRRYIPEINSRNRSVRQFAERTAVNTPIQGTAADMIKVAMIEVYQKIKKMKSKMILQVHDELVFDVYKDELDDMKDIVKTTMESSVKLDVPVKVDMGVGENWLECK